MWKLIKHQLKGRRTLYITGLIIMLAITVYLGTQLNMTPAAIASDKGANAAIIAGLAFCWCVFYMVMTIVNVVSYTGELYGDTSYLIFSLPLRGWQILGSRVVLMVVDTLMTLAGGMATVITLACISPDIGSDVRPYVGRFLLTGDYWLLCLLMLAMIICGVLVFFFGNTLGKTFSNSRKGLSVLLAPVVIVFILWMVGRAATLLISAGGPTFSLNPFKYVSPMTSAVNGFAIPVIPLALLLAVGVAVFALTAWLMDRHLNL